MLIDTVVDDFIDEVMEAVHAGAADVHRRPLPHGVQAFQYFDLIRAVAVGFLCGFGVVTGHQSPIFTGIRLGAERQRLGRRFLPRPRAPLTLP